MSSPPFLLRMAALARLADAQKKQAAARKSKVEAGAPTCISRALERSALDDMDIADMYFNLATTAE